MRFRIILSKPIIFALGFLIPMIPAHIYAQSLTISKPARTPPNALADFGDYPIHAGSFLVTPSLKLEQQYNTNVFATENNEESDQASIIEPSIAIQKAVRDHEFALNAKSTVFRYWSNGSENIENYEANFKSKIIAHSTLKIPTEIRYQIGHKERLQERTATNKPDKPTKFHNIKAETGLEYNPNRLLVGLYGGYSTMRFDNGATSTGIPVIREDGDYNRYTGELLVRYETARQWSPFASLLIGKTDFERGSFDGATFSGPKRDNTVMRAMTGLGFNLKELLKGDIAIGKDWRDYDESGVDSISSMSAEASITWLPAQGTSLVFEASHRTEEDDELNNGIIETDLSSKLSYELQEDIFLRALVGYENADFDSSNRKDKTYQGGLGVSYVISPKLQIGGDIVQSIRQSNVADADYEQTLFMLRLIGSL